MLKIAPPLPVAKQWLKATSTRETLAPGLMKIAPPSLRKEQN
jgi:hypothetical protein